MPHKSIWGKNCTKFLWFLALYDTDYEMKIFISVVKFQEEQTKGTRFLDVSSNLSPKQVIVIFCYITGKYILIILKLG